jgi:hypothetical protein
VDVRLAFYWRALLSPRFPRSLPHFREFGRRVGALIQEISAAYRTALGVSEEGSLPILCRLVDAINVFGCVVLKYSPVIRGIEANGLDPTAIGSHASLMDEFMDKSQEPLPDLLPTSAVLHFNAVQNIPTIPKRYLVKMCVYLGQCLHAIANDNVTLQNAVKYLWKGSLLLTELEQFDVVGEVASELAGVLKETDITGALFQYLCAQSSIAYQSRVKMLITEFETSNRERLFLSESERLRALLLNPEVSPMFTAAQKYFAAIPNGIHLIRLGHTMDQIKAFITANKNCTICILDNLPDSERTLTGAVIVLGDPDRLQTVSIEIDLDDMAMKYEVFKQIIAPSKAATAPVSDGPATRQASPGGKGKPKPAKKVPAKGSVGLVQDDQSLSFAKEAVKLNHPEFQKFVADLNTAFDPLKPLLADRKSDAVLFLSSIKTAHVIPLEIVDAFGEFATIYRDFSIMAALNRKTLSTEAPTFGNAN